MKTDLLSKYRFDSNKPVVGRYHATKKGIGFVQPEEDPDGEDMYIAKEDTLGAMDGDLVSVQVVQEGFNIRNVVTEVLEHRHTKLCGVVVEEKNKMFVSPINTKLPDVKIGKKHTGDAAADDLVVVNLLSYGDGTAAPTGAVVEDLGNKEKPGADITAIVRELDVPTAFTEEEEQQARSADAGQWENGTSEAAGNSAEGNQTGNGACVGTEESREDLRELPTVSIDEPGTEDMDDAVSLVRTQEGLWRLGVHIADASYYVREGTPLDRVARERGTSVYLPDRVIPMLPEALSTGTCSLRAGEDKLAMSVLMDFDEDGNQKTVKIVPSIIRVDANMNYPEAQAVLDGAAENKKAGAAELSDELKAMIREMDQLAQKLSDRRKERGEVAFDLPDVKIILDENGKPASLEVTHENEAQKMVSAFMVAANEAVAQYMKEQGIPGIFRVHEVPEEEAVTAWRSLVGGTDGTDPDQQADGRENDGNESAGSCLRPSDVQYVLEQARGTEDENFVTLATLRMMNHAHYDPECRGHFGLATPYYCHFTSPIRRYPDLVVHRLLHESLSGRLTEDKKASFQSGVAELCDHCSEMEHRSIVCERDADRLKMTQYMGMHLQEESDGVISRVTKNGFFVELPDTCEGFVSVQSLGDDYYAFEEDACRLVGKNTGRVLRLGDVVRIRIVSADVMERSAEFELA